MSSWKNNKPLFQHDCKACVFLGNMFVDQYDKIMDLYYCPGILAHNGDGSLIGRYGNDVTDYISTDLSTALRIIERQPFFTRMIARACSIDALKKEHLWNAVNSWDK